MFMSVFLYSIEIQVRTWCKLELHLSMKIVTSVKLLFSYSIEIQVCTKHNKNKTSGKTSKALF